MTKSSGYKTSPLVFALKVGLFYFAIWFASNSTQTKADEFIPARGDSANLSSYTTKDEWLSSDKFAHLTISLFLSSICYKAYHDNYYNSKGSSVLFSGGLVLSLGLGKEFYDRTRPKNRFSYRDLVADVLGIGIGLFLATNY